MDGSSDSPSDIDPAFEIVEPQQCSGPLVFNSPHAGNLYPPSFLAHARLPISELRRSADLYVDDLIIGAVRRGVPLLRAHFPRCFIDVNREPYELDPGMFTGRLPSFANTKSTRVAAGYGTIARLVGEQQEIYGRRFAVADALNRIDQYYLPYHAALRRLVTRAHRTHGHAILIDWHSMPSAVFPLYRKVDFVLGDRHGTSCSAGLIERVEQTLTGLGYSVQRNQPYAGGFITQHYGNPRAGLHALQIEINRALYMDEVNQEPNGGFDGTRDTLAMLTDILIATDDMVPATMPLAAE